MVFRYTSLNQVSGILLFFNLQQSILRGILQALFPVFRIINFEFHDDRRILRILRFHHHIIAPEAALTVGSHHILICLVYNKPQHKTMIEPLRFFLPGRSVSCIKIAEGIRRHPVHIIVHAADVSSEHGGYKFIKCSTPVKPINYHPAEHPFHFIIGNLQTVNRRVFRFFLQNGFNLQIA